PGEIDQLRRDYLRYLGRTRATVRENAERQRRAMNFRRPYPTELTALIGTERMWERGPEHPDLLTARVGPGRQALATTLEAPATGPVEELEPLSLLSLRRFVEVHSFV